MCTNKLNDKHTENFLIKIKEYKIGEWIMITFPEWLSVDFASAMWNGFADEQIGWPPLVPTSPLVSFCHVKNRNTLGDLVSLSMIGVTTLKMKTCV